MTLTRSLAALFVAAALAVPSALPQSALADETTPTPNIVSENSGTCPFRTIYDRPIPPQCTGLRSGNARTPNFRTPAAPPWGVAYAYNCGKKARKFDFYERLPGGDHMGLHGLMLHGKRGSGYLMISAAEMEKLENVDPLWRNVMEISISSECTWHVRVVVGPESDVAASVPAIPDKETPWWPVKYRRKHGV